MMTQCIRTPAVGVPLTRFLYGPWADLNLKLFASIDSHHDAVILKLYWGFKSLMYSNLLLHSHFPHQWTMHSLL